ncbi:MAG: FAD-dependent oxidoreductase, partial [Actinobacteria bacterium]|nr:FAD-dependent oxidoreductase [Actinomycetota bacterium]
LHMLTEVKRFHRRARHLLDGDADPTLSQFLRQGRFSHYFAAHFIAPLVSAVWSCAPSAAGEYPARYLFMFLANHGMLTVTGAPPWYTVVGGTARYVEKVAKDLSAVNTSVPVRAIRRRSDGVELRDDADTVHHFDGVVLATHPDQALRILEQPLPAESAVLGAITYTRNPTLLHTDRRVLPTAHRAQASWNYRLPGCRATPSTVNVSYNMNRLQRLQTDEQYVVTLNGEDSVDPDTVLARMTYEHPVYTAESVAARARLTSLNGHRVAYAGAYHGWGFHEDGARSGVEAAAALGVNW